MPYSLDHLHSRARNSRLLKMFTIFTRILLALAFLPSGLTKVMGNRFTVLGIEDPVGFFFEALYRTGFYWRFLGFCQLVVALLLLIPRTATLGRPRLLSADSEYLCDYSFHGFHRDPDHHRLDAARKHLFVMLGLRQTQKAIQSLNRTRRMCDE